MKSLNLMKNPGMEVRDALKLQTSVLKAFLEETKSLRGLSDEALASSYELFVADDHSELSVMDKSLGIPAFSFRNKFVKTKEGISVVFSAVFGEPDYQESTYPETCKVLAAL